MKARTRKAPPRRQDEQGATLESSPQLSLLERLEAGESPAAAAGHVLSLLGGRAGARIGFAFRMMEVAEELIEARWPGRDRRETSNAFALAWPTAPVRVSERLYRAHVEELLQRFPDASAVVDPRSGAIWRGLELLTRAEVVGLLVEASLRHPLGHRDVVLYEALFTELWPEDAARILDHGDSYGAGSVDETKRARREWLSQTSPERAEAVAELRQKAREARAGVQP